MKRYRRLLIFCLVLLMGAACAERPEVVEITREVVVLETAVPPPEVTPLEPSDLFLRPTEVTVVIDQLPTATFTPTAVPQPKELVICQAREPDSLFLYSIPMLDKENIHHAIYENLVTQLDYGYQAQGIEKLPSLENGDAVLQTVTVKAGDTVLSANDEVVTLVAGIEVLNVAGERVIFGGTPLKMGQLVVDFTLKPMVWSDGTPVSAADSVFSFEVNRTVVADTYRIERTSSYEAIGDLSLRWTGLPVWLDRTFFLNVWTPLPEHQLGQYFWPGHDAFCRARESQRDGLVKRNV